MRSCLCATALTFLLVTACLAGDGGSESPFSLGPGARDLALGGAALADAAPAAAAYWNASFLAHAERMSVMAHHVRLFEPGIGYQYFGIALPTLDAGGFGVGVFRLGVDDVDERDGNNLQIGSFGEDRIAAHLSYGRAIGAFDAGVSLHLEHHAISTVKATSSPGMTLSVGRRLNLPYHLLSGVDGVLVIRNVIKPSYKLSRESYSYPVSADAAVTIHVLSDSLQLSGISLSAKLAKVEKSDLHYALGIEGKLMSALAFRAGMRDGRLSAGLGVKVKSVGFDYALVDRDLGSLHMFSFTLDIGTPVSKRREVRERERERRFAEVMNDRIQHSNLIMIAELVEHSRALRDSGYVAQAVTEIDRAMFVAASSGLDSATVSQSAQVLRSEMLEQLRRTELKSLLDSASMFLSCGSLIQARAVAETALAQDSNSVRARQIIDSINAEMEKNAETTQSIEAAFLHADSLLTYGKYAEAVTILRSLKRAGLQPERALLELRKAEFEQFREQATASLGRRDFAASRHALDSAKSRLPGHPWCTSFEKKQLEEIQTSQKVQVSTSVPKAKPLTSQIQHEVSEIYKSGQEMFEQGKLSEAVALWEKVEVLAPGYLSTHDFLVRAYKFLGVELYGKSQLREAITVWKKAAELEPGNSEIASYILRTEGELAKVQELSYDQ